MLYYPEGMLLPYSENTAAFQSDSSLFAAASSERILEGRAICCDESHNLIVSLPNQKTGIIPREEGAIGIKEGATGDIAIISRVSKPVCFVVTGGIGNDKLILSRRRAQELCKQHYISSLAPGDIIPAVVTHFENYGSFVDIGCGIASLIPIDSISISRISHPRDRFHNEQQIYAVVKSIAEDGKICLSHKELLGTWMQNAELFHAGETVCGIVRSITNYGIFVELMPNLAGLAELKPDVHIGDSVSVFIKSLIPEKMKVKLAIVDAFPSTEKPKPLHYYITRGKLTRWQYSPDCCGKVLETDFMANV